MDIRITKRFDFFLEVKVLLWGKTICDSKSLEANFWHLIRHI